MMKFWLYKISRQLIRRYDYFKKYEFEKKILNRWSIFWKNSGNIQELGVKKYADSTFDEWKSIENWQRRLSNKHNAKEFAKKLHCKVAKVYWQGNNDEFQNFDMSKLPKNFIFKPVKGYGSKKVFLIKDKINLFSGKKYSQKQIRDKIENLLEFRNEIIIEEFLPNEKGEIVVPNDYRFYTFNGEILFIQLDKRKAFKKDQVSFYDEDWNLIKNKILVDAITDKYDDAPICFNEMKVEVKKLSKQYKIFCRIDFYATNKGAVFGEFTPTPRKGKNLTKFGNNQLIKAWETYCNGMV